jgi:hypothetical protein
LNTADKQARRLGRSLYTVCSVKIVSMIRDVVTAGVDMDLFCRFHQSQHPRLHLFRYLGREIMSKKYLLCVVSVVLLITMPAYSVQYIDEFEYAKPATTSFVAEGVFQHNIVPIPTANHVGWDIDDWPTHDGNSLDLYPAIDEVTFLLGPGEYVEYASVDLVNGGGSNSFEAIGTQGSYMVQDTPFLQWQTADTTGENLGQIIMVKLLAYEGAFDNLTINVVPEPFSLGLMGIGGLILALGCRELCRTHPG